MIVMVRDDDKISSLQQGIIQLLAVLGVGVLSLPSTVVEQADNDAWMVVLIAGLANVFFAYLISRVVINYGRYGFVGGLRYIFGSFIGTLLAIPCILYFIGVTAMILRIFGETSKIYLLPRTPLEYIIIPIAVVTIILVRSGIEPIARFFELITPFVLVLLIAIFILIIPNSDYSNLKPFFNTPLSKYIRGISMTIFAFSGYEIILVVGKNIRKPQKAFKASAYSVTLMALIYAVITIQSIARFGVEETKTLIYPLISLVKASDVPGAFLERVEGLVLAMWVLFVYTSLTAYMYMYSVVGSDILNQRENKHMASAFLPIVYLIALQGDSVPDVFKLVDKISIYLGTYTIIIIPILMLIFGKLLRKGGRNIEA